MSISRKKLDKELAELVGAFIGDGFIGRYGGSYHVEFTGDRKSDERYFEFLSNIITSNFKVRPRIKFHEGTIRLLVTYKEFYEFFRALGFRDGIKNNVVFIPKEFYRLNLIKYVVRGLFDTDGFIFVDKRPIYRNPYIRIGYTTKSKKLYNQIRALFLRRGYSLYTRVDKRSMAFNIEIYGNKQAVKWVKEFGFSNINKKNMPQWLSGRASAT